MALVQRRGRQTNNRLATFRTEPQTYNRFVSPRSAEDLFARLTQATLVRLNRVTGELEPWLAASWTSSSADGRVWTLKLRPGVVFSDGAPFSAARLRGARPQRRRGPGPDSAHWTWELMKSRAV